jgi:hypothetical protein
MPSARIEPWHPADFEVSSQVVDAPNNKNISEQIQSEGESSATIQ